MALNINFNSFNNRTQAAEGKGNVNLPESIKRALVKSGLTEGSVFSGKIQDITGNSVKILLDGGNTLLATLENGTEFNIGEKVNFLVKSNDGAKILLQSVENAGENKISQSLMNFMEQTGLSVNDRNVAMIKEMMAYGMSLDNSSLRGMERLSSAFPDAEIEDIVKLSIHNIPVTEENLGQLQSYRSYEHRITENIDNLAKELMQLSESRPDIVKGIVEDIMKMMSDTAVQNTGAETANAETANAEANGLSGSYVQTTGAETNGMSGYNEMNVNENYVKNGDIQHEMINGQSLSENVMVSSHDNMDNGNGNASVTNTIIDDSQNNLASVKFNINDIASEKITVADNNYNINTEDKRNAVNLAGTGLSDENNLQRLIRDSVRELKNRWMLNSNILEENKGEEIKNIINEKLQTLYESAEKIMNSFKNNGMERSDTYKTAENIKNNLQFMNDLNHMASYVQVPYKTLSGEANGELFVYNRNKNKSLEDGPLTAFLHLDMEYLGDTDVKVSMDSAGKVSAKFSLSDKISQDIVEEHLPELKKRLENQGYTVQLTTEIIESGEQISPFQQILEADRPRSEVKRYGFDIRL